MLAAPMPPFGGVTPAGGADGWIGAVILGVIVVALVVGTLVRRAKPRLGSQALDLDLRTDRAA